MNAARGSGFAARLASLAEASPATVPVADVRLEEARAGGVTVRTLAGPLRRVAAVRLCWPGGSAGEAFAQAGLHAVTMQALIRTPAPGGAASLAERLESAGIAVEAGHSARLLLVSGQEAARRFGNLVQGRCRI